MRACSEQSSLFRQCPNLHGRPHSALKVCTKVVPSRQQTSHLRQRDTAVLASSATKEELEANLQRWEESGKQGNSDSWQWTLNWNEIDDKILVGSCPRSTKDVVELKRVAEVDAILCLQSDGCFEALKIDYGELRDKGAQLGVVMSRVAIWDFNHNDQALMIPEAIRKLALLLAMGKRVYVHCTAGINRATLTVVGYLTFVKGWSLDDAVREVKGKRPQAHPYLDCWHTMRTRFTEGRTQELLQTASRIYEERKAKGREHEGDSVGDWVLAENALITEQYQRQIQADLSMMMSFTEQDNALRENSVCLSTQEYNTMQAEMGVLREKAEKDRARARDALANAAQVSDENKRLREANPDAVALLESAERKARLKSAEREINALKGAIRQVAFAALSANSGSDEDHLRASGGLDPANPNGTPNATTATQTKPTAAPTAPVNGSEANGATINGATVSGTSSERHEGVTANGTTVNGAKANGSKVNDSVVNGNDTAAKLKGRKTSGRSSARAHNGAHPSDDVIMRGNGSSTPGRKWPLGATWPFRNNRDNGASAPSSATVASTPVTTGSHTTSSSENVAGKTEGSSSNGAGEKQPKKKKPEDDEDAEYCI